MPRWLALLAIPAAAAAALSPQQREAIDKALGATGTYSQAEDTHRLTFPRRDVPVTVDGTELHPFMGLTSWAAFTGASYTDTAATPPKPVSGVMVMGDLVLFQDEVNPVMSAALDAGLEVTALHNHFFHEEPRVMFMHIGGMGETTRMAAAVKKCLDRVAEIRKAVPRPQRSYGGPAVPPVSAIAKQALDTILRTDGQGNGGMYKATFGRRVKMHGHTAGNQMGVNTWAAFFGSMPQAFVDGDFACHPAELQTVLRSLRRRGIQIVAIHNHMTEEEPKLVFLHFWGKGSATELAVALRATLDEQARYFPMTNR